MKMPTFTCKSFTKCIRCRFSQRDTCTHRERISTVCIGAWDAYFYIGTPILIEMVKISLFAWDAYFSNRMPIFTLRRGNVTQIRKKASMKRLLKRNLAAYGFWQVIICVTNYNLPPSYQFFKSLHIFPFIQPQSINRVLHRIKSLLQII